MTKAHPDCFIQTVLLILLGKGLNMGALWHILLLSTLYGCSMEVGAVEVSQVWIKYITELLRKYEASVAGEYI